MILGESFGRLPCLETEQCECAHHRFQTVGQVNVYVVICNLSRCCQILITISGGFATCTSFRSETEQCECAHHRFQTVGQVNVYVVICNLSRCCQILITISGGFATCTSF